MKGGGRTPAERRLLVLAPTRKDSEFTCATMREAGIECEPVADLETLRREIAVGAGAVLLPEEALAEDDAGSLAELIARQPRWSDLPILLLTWRGADSAAVTAAVHTLGNVTVIERPTRVVALLTAARAALRARERQYQIRAYIQDRERTAEELRDADRRKDEFLAMLSHELRNPLAPIRNALHVLRMSDDSPQTLREVRAMMERQIDHLMRLVDDLMEVSRITRGKIELKKTRADLAGIVRGAVETSRPLIDAARHHLTVSLPETPVFLDADPVRLGQVFSNLLNNAAKYTDRGGRIAVVARRRGDEVEVSVADDGIGISAEVLPKVFDLFMQADRAVARAQGGLGIGLTLVRSIVQLHGGTVEARSAGPGKGSEFVVRLPVGAAADARPAAPAPGRAQVGAAGRRIVVADDNRDQAESLGMLLRRLGADVAVVFDGHRAVEAVRTHGPSIVFLDIGMPGMDGLETARRMRALPTGGGLTLVALTGWGQEEFRRRCLAAGFDRHLIKPAELSALQSILAAGDPVASSPSR